MKKRLTVQRLTAYLLCLAASCMLVVGTSYSRFSAQVRGDATAGVAAVVMEAEIAPSLDLTTALSGLKPGGSKTISFTVTNQKDGAVSEVAQEYTVQVKTTGNLPLTYSLKADTPAAGQGETALAGDVSGLTWAGGTLPAGQAATHTYTLTVAWPADKTDAAYAQEIDLISLYIQAAQALPLP